VVFEAHRTPHVIALHGEDHALHRTVIVPGRPVVSTPTDLCAGTISNIGTGQRNTKPLLILTIQHAHSQQSVKLNCPTLATASDGSLISRHLFFNDRSSGYRYLVDTGADISVIPPSSGDHRKQSDRKLCVKWHMYRYIWRTPFKARPTVHQFDYLETFSKNKNPLLISQFSFSN
jgi:hypothetical protein